MPFRLEVPRRLYDQMLEQARAELPNECCGWLAGTVADGLGRVVRRFPLVNEAASPIRYSASSRSLAAAHRELREHGLEVLAIYHSHPTSAPIPSRTDLEMSYWPGVVSLIVSLMGTEPQVRGWWLTEADYREAEWGIVEEIG